MVLFGDYVASYLKSCGYEVIGLGRRKEPIDKTHIDDYIFCDIDSNLMNYMLDHNVSSRVYAVTHLSEIPSWKSLSMFWEKELGVRHYIYAKDIAQAIDLAIRTESAHGIYNLSSYNLSFMVDKG